MLLIVQLSQNLLEYFCPNPVPLTLPQCVTTHPQATKFTSNAQLLSPAAYCNVTTPCLDFSLPLPEERLITAWESSKKYIFAGSICVKFVLDEVTLGKVFPK